MIFYAQYIFLLFNRKASEFIYKFFFGFVLKIGTHPSVASW